MARLRRRALSLERMLTIIELVARAFDVPLVTPFGIATGTQEVANNVLCTLRLSDGTLGLGEAAPFPAVSGETQAQVLGALDALGAVLPGQDAERYRHVAGLAREVLEVVPSALAALDIALLDALCRRAGRSMWHHFGGSEPRLVTDITIPTGDVAAARAAAKSAREGGFRELKIKVGRGDLDLDAERVRAAHAAAPECTLILDANAGLDARDALALLGALGSARARVVLFEQPVARDDWDGLSEVEREGGVPVAADESARSAREVAELARRQVVSVINVKTAKTGLFGAWDMASVARAHGLGLMIGGMVETELSMTASASLAGGMGGFRYVDLDTFFFMGPRPLTGGFGVRGPELDLEAIGAGHGVEVASE
jgi:L-alanine-DL-glutamate epimerase-like enolase superfamily enzyme